MSRSQKKDAVREGRFVVSERRSCELVGLHRTVFRHKKVDKDSVVKAEIRRIALKKKRYGTPRICEVLNRTMHINHKRVERLYSEMELKYRRKRSKKRYTGEKVPMIIPHEINQRWSMDFVWDVLSDGRRFRVFNLIDDCSRESIVQHVDFSIGGYRLVRIFEELKRKRTLPKQLVCDNGTEFTSHVFRAWAENNNIELCFIDKGKPTQNAFIESFNGKFRDECLNEERFLSISWARSIIETWRIEYNAERPHSGLNGLTPYEFIAQSA